MRRLIVMRHAKASWDDAAEDFDRALTERGRRDARRIAIELVSLGWVPERVLTSEAVRARQTWEAMAEGLSPPAPLGAGPASVSIRASLYHAGLDAFEEAVRTVPDEVGTLLVIGHNPGWEQVVRALTGRTVPLGTADAVLLTAVGASAPGWSAALAARDFDIHAVLRPRGG